MVFFILWYKVYNIHHMPSTGMRQKGSALGWVMAENHYVQSSQHGLCTLKGMVFLTMGARPSPRARAAAVILKAKADRGRDGLSPRERFSQQKGTPKRPEPDNKGSA